MMKFWQASAVAEGGAFCLTAMAQTLRSPFDRTCLEETCPTTQYAQYSASGVAWTSLCIHGRCGDGTTRLSFVTEDVVGRCDLLSV